MKNINTMLHLKLNSAVSALAVAAAFSVLLPPSNAYCGVCFLPDCQDSDTLHGDINMNVNNDTEWCEKKGYTYYSSGKCPQYYAQVGKCKKDDYYLKCDAKTWCQQNGYNTTTCSIPNYVDQPCPSFATLYKGCKRDNQRACRDTGYTNSCPSGQKLHASGRCSYDNNFGTCCRPSGCPANTSLSYSSYGANGSDGCGYTCYYTCNPNCPSGTSTSNPGGCGGSTKNGCRTKTCYYPYQSCCTPYGDESGCNCYSCSDGCGGTRKCCGSCYTPPPSSGNSGGSGGGSGSGGSGSSGSGSSGNKWVGYVRAAGGGSCSPSGSGYHWVHKVTKGCRNTSTGEENDVFTTSACYSNGTIYLTKEDCEKNGTGKYGYTSENCGSCSDKNTTCDGKTSSYEGTCN